LSAVHDWLFSTMYSKLHSIAGSSLHQLQS
jgi:hypothetical protein